MPSVKSITRNKKSARRPAQKFDYKDFSRTGPGTLAGRYLRKMFWWPVYRSQDLKPGRAAPIRLLCEEFALYRGAGGEVHVFEPRCPHRGTLLSTGWVEDDSLRCFYHGWKFNSAGQCIEQPAENNRFAQKVKIRSYPVKEYLGLVFVYLGDGAPPPFPRYHFMEERDESECVRAVLTDVKPYNFRNRIENSVDPVHVAFVHRNSEYRGLTGCPRVEAEETDYGMILRAIRPDGSVRVTQFEMPTLLYIKQGPRSPEEKGWRDFLNWRVPIDDETNRGFSVTLARLSGDSAKRFIEQQEARMQKDPALEIGEAVLAGKMHVDDITDLQLAVNVQDYVAQRGQGVISGRAGERLGRSDAGVILLRKIYAREMKTMAQGKKMKRWSPLVPAATIGT
ncbi:MAG TPA: Rieske 2Fe-2S domain-containing protein [Candidatus Binatia bacterium]